MPQHNPIAHLVERALREYSPDQPRDERGRWTGDNGPPSWVGKGPVQLGSRGPVSSATLKIDTELGRRGWRYSQRKSANVPLGWGVYANRGWPGHTIVVSAKGEWVYFTPQSGTEPEARGKGADSFKRYLVGDERFVDW